VTSAAIDRLLFVLIGALAVTGGVSLISGAPGAAWLFVLHDLLAGLLAVTVVAKLRASLPRAVHGRRWTRLAVALVVTIAAVGSLVAGFVWVAGGSLVWLDVGPLRWSLLTIHAVFGVALLPLLVVHLVPRRWRVLRVPATGAVDSLILSRRALLGAAGYSVIAVGLVAAATNLDRLAGGVRRFTGSRWLPAGPPGVPTTFLGEPVPAVDLATWRLRVAGRVAAPVELDLSALAEFGSRDVTAVLDCTSGWAVEGTWSGIALGDLLDAAGVATEASRVDVVAVTGWRATLPLPTARACLLAVAEHGRPLAAEHGAPLRLVAPAHRGLEWVKWVDRIEVA
jgi:DMSO/TMAO reductase YedYZ molybdopterin-dependent catalytic subunit